MALQTENKDWSNWDILRPLSKEQLETIEVFCGFQIFVGDEAEPKSGGLFLTKNDEMYAIGYNNSDNLLAIDEKDFVADEGITKPTKVNGLSGKKIKKFTIAEKFGAALTEKGKLLYWGREIKKVRNPKEDVGQFLMPYEPYDGFGIKDIACGRYFVALLTQGNDVIIWGYLNDDRKLYDFEKIQLENNRNTLTGIACGWYHVAILDETGEVKTFGRGDSAQLGYCWEIKNGYSDPQRVNAGYERCKKIDCGAFSTVMLLENGDLYITGDDKAKPPCPQYGTIETVQIDLSAPAVDIAAASGWISGKIESKYAYRTGTGRGTVNLFDRKPESSKSVEEFTNLGDAFANFRTPQSLSERQVVEDDLGSTSTLGQTGNIDSLPPESILRKWPVFHGLEAEFVKEIKYFTVFGGYDGGEIKHSLGAFVVKNDDSVYGIGLSGVRKYLGVTGENAGEYFHRKPIKIDNLGGKNLKKIVLNHSKGTALSGEGSVYIWDELSKPEKVNFSDNSPVVDVAGGARFFLYLLEDSRLYFDGEISSDYAPRKFAEISNPGHGRIESIACGEWHCAVLTGEKEVYTFGHGIYYQLGYKWKDTDSPFQPRKVPLPSKCKKVICGVSSTLFLTPIGDLFACGINRFADVLGVGHGDSVLEPQKIPYSEPIEDICVAVRNDNFGARVSVYAAKTKSGKILRWGGSVETPAIVEGVSTLLEAFAGQEIPQSMSLVSIGGKYERNIQTSQPPKVGTKPKAIGAPKRTKPNTTAKPSVAKSPENGKGKPIAKGSGFNPKPTIPKPELVTQSIKNSDERKSPRRNSDEKKAAELPKQEKQRGPDMSRTLSFTPNPTTSKTNGVQLTETNSTEPKLENAYIPLNTSTAEKAQNTDLDSQLSDVAIKLKNGAIHAHKAMLLNRSKLFRKILTDGGVADELDFSKYNPNAVKAFVRFIYGEPIEDVGTVEDILDFHDLIEMEGDQKSIDSSLTFLFRNLMYNVLDSYVREKYPQLKDRLTNYLNLMKKNSTKL